ncbi:MAG: ABC transporter ATP-binding protein, partial [Mesorhizobium sp.]
MLLASSQFDELRLDRMSRSFGTVNALKDISLTIRKGEFIALLGPSGCGKSTALNCLAGLLATTGGSIYLDDRRLDQLKPEDRGFGMVFQNYALFPHMTVEDNIAFPLKMRKVSDAEARKRTMDALETVRLPHVAKR